MFGPPGICHLCAHRAQGAICRFVRRSSSIYAAAVSSGSASRRSATTGRLDAIPFEIGRGRCRMDIGDRHSSVENPTLSLAPKEIVSKRPRAFTKKNRARGVEESHLATLVVTAGLRPYLPHSLSFCLRTQTHRARFQLALGRSIPTRHYIRPKKLLLSTFVFIRPVCSQTLPQSHVEKIRL